MKLFTRSQEPGSSLASILGFVVDSHLAYWKPTLVGGVWLRLAADHPHVPVWQAPGGGSNGLHIRSHHRPRRLSLTASTPPLSYSHTKSSHFYMQTEDYAAKRTGSLVLDRDFSSAMRFYKTMFIAPSAATSWKCTRAVSMIFLNLPSVP
jgi:hypothetical protein